jgi:cell fate (sporulation/competence/biofilm development) regulator YmcA (YheA/YmcA/DUF963 family)
MYGLFKKTEETANYTKVTDNSQATLMELLDAFDKSLVFLSGNDNTKAANACIAAFNVVNARLNTLPFAERSKYSVDFNQVRALLQNVSQNFVWGTTDRFFDQNINQMRSHVAAMAQLAAK